MFPSDGHLDDLKRYGMDPDPWGRDAEYQRWSWGGGWHPVVEKAWEPETVDEDGDA